MSQDKEYHDFDCRYTTFCKDLMAIRYGFARGKSQFSLPAISYTGGVKPHSSPLTLWLYLGHMKYI